MKPVCPELYYVQPDELAKKRCAQIKAIVKSNFGSEFAKPQQRRFGFVQELSNVERQKILSKEL